MPPKKRAAESDISTYFLKKHEDNESDPPPPPPQSKRGRKATGSSNGGCDASQQQNPKAKPAAVKSKARPKRLIAKSPQQQKVHSIEKPDDQADQSKSKSKEPEATKTKTSKTGETGVVAESESMESMKATQITKESEETKESGKINNNNVDAPAHVVETLIPVEPEPSASPPDKVGVQTSLSPPPPADSDPLAKAEASVKSFHETAETTEPHNLTASGESADAKSTLTATAAAAAAAAADVLACKAQHEAEKGLTNSDDIETDACTCGSPCTCHHHSRVPSPEHAAKSLADEDADAGADAFEQSEQPELEAVVVVPTPARSVAVPTDHRVVQTATTVTPSAGLTDAERHFILARLFRWPFLAVATLYKFSTHPLRQTARSCRDSLVKVLTDVRSGIHGSLPSFFSRFENCNAPGSTSSSSSHSHDPEQQSFCENLRNKISGVTISTCFSGVDTPCTSYMGIAWAFFKEAGRPIEHMPHPRNLFAVEKFSKSRDELLHHPHEAEHIFDDVELFWKPDVRHQLRQREHTSQFIEDVIIPAVLSGHAATDSACCSKHNRVCKVSSARVHVAGTPCTVFSLKSGQLRELGLTFILFLAWISQRLLLQEEVIVQENVPQFPVELLSRFLGHLYFIETCILSPLDIGWGVQRRRRWTVLRHKYKTKAFKSPLNAFAAMFNCPPWFGLWEMYSERCPAWDIFFCGTKREIVAELIWAASRPGSQWSESSLLHEEDMMKRNLTAEHFVSALTQCEHNHLTNYISRSGPDDHLQVFSLNQNPEHVDARSSWDRLQTLIKNAGVMWSEYHKRWLLSYEALAAQGFPCWSEFTDHVPMCSFAKCRDHSSASRTATIGMAGNAMHAHSCGIVLLYVLTQVEGHDESPFASLAAILEADFC